MALSSFKYADTITETEMPVSKSRCVILAAALGGGLAGCGDEAGGEAGGVSCAPVLAEGACGVPYLPRISALHVGATWAPPPVDGRLELSLDGAPWAAAASFTITEAGPLTVSARVVAEGCEPAPVTWRYEGVEAYDGAESAAVAAEDERIVGWAEAVASVRYGEAVEDRFRTPELALGPPQATAFGVVSLGRGGEITVRLGTPASDGPGPDLAIFENSFSPEFLELAYVEVSSDGEIFAPLPSAYLGVEPVEAYALQSPTLIEGLAGKYRAGYGAPFDLNVLAWHPAVVSGAVDLAHVEYVRVTDVVGDGESADSFGAAIYDPYPTVGSAGFDLDAVAVLRGEGAICPE